MVRVRVRVLVRVSITWQAHRVGDLGVAGVLIAVPAPRGRLGAVEHQHAVPKARLSVRRPYLRAQQGFRRRAES